MTGKGPTRRARRAPCCSELDRDRSREARCLVVGVDVDTVGSVRLVFLVPRAEDVANLDLEIDFLTKERSRLAGHDIKVRRTYADVKPGEYVALINSFGVLEIARAEQRAADGLGVGRGAPVTVRELG